jgi:fucose 4-O-acetylase-like acetyltransferase
MPGTLMKITGGALPGQNDFRRRPARGFARGSTVMGTVRGPSVEPSGGPARLSVATRTEQHDTSDSVRTRIADPVTPSRSPAPERQRDPLLDNVKVLAVVLVVVGHSWNNLRGLVPVEGAYLLLYLFHMPLFVLVTGYLSRGAATLTSSRAQRIVGGLVVPYLVFQSGYGVLADLADIEPAQPGLVSPSWLMWFLAALACWRVTAPVWSHLRAPVAVAVVVSLLGGITSEGALALTQVLGLLPFFVLGLRLRPRHLAWLRTPRVRALAVGVLAVAAVTCYVRAPLSDQEMEWVYWRSSYAQLGAGWLEGGLVRLGLLLAGVVLAAAFIALAPRRRRWFTTLGAYTMYAYLLHGLVVLAALALGLFDLATAHPLLGVPATTAAAALTAWLLMSRPVRHVMRPVVQPDVGFLWRRG